MRIVYMGTPDFAVPALEALAESRHTVVLAVTQPDRARGRGHKLVSTPVKESALKLGIQIAQPQRLKDNTEFFNQLKELKPDLIVVAAYGRILPKSILELPERGCINIHASLLPKYRGAAPIQRAIMNGEKETGNTLMYMEEGLDTGDMISSVKIDIGRDNYGQLSDKLAILGSELLMQNLEDILSGNVSKKKQKEENATYSPMISKSEAFIDFTEGACMTDCRIRGVNPNPGAYTYYKDEKMKIVEAEPCEGRTNEKDGTILDVSDRGIVVASAGEKINITKLQMPGKRALTIKEFLPGNKIERQQRLGRIKHGQ